MDKIMNIKNVIFIGDYFSMIVSVAVSEESVKEGESYEDACLRSAGNILKEQYGWDVVAVSNHIGVLDEGDSNCETCYGEGKVRSEVGGQMRQLECPDCFIK
jgi:DnaJ-class molecular chaperone